MWKTQPSKHQSGGTGRKSKEIERIVILWEFNNRIQTKIFVEVWEATIGNILLVVATGSEKNTLDC